MILTTNNYQRLLQDKKSVDALLRPGRVSLAANFDTPSPQQLKQYFLRMFRTKRTRRAVGTGTSTKTGSEQAKGGSVLVEGSDGSTIVGGHMQCSGKGFPGLRGKMDPPYFLDHRPQA